MSTTTAPTTTPAPGQPSEQELQQLGQQMGQHLTATVQAALRAQQRQRERQAYIAAAIPALIAGTFQRQQGTPLALVRAIGSSEETGWPELLSSEEMEHIAAQAFLLAENLLIHIESEDAQAGQG